DNLVHKFTLAGPDLANPDFNFLWDFGDGGTSTEREPTHTYASAGSYQVVLKANNFLNCGTPVTLPIVVSPRLIAEFSILPDSVIFIPNYHFSFRDQSQGTPLSWDWDFDSPNHQNSPQQNPEITYGIADTGYHKITLTIIDKDGCTKTKSHTVHITGTPGQLFVPNAFIPTSTTTAVQTFMAKGAGLKTWRMQIYNKWGQLVWQTDKLSAKGEPIDGWDGNYQGSPAPQGAYVWQINAKFVNGTDWKGMSYNNSPPKRTGVINLIR
ncbi:MAG: PKD domain-containing protein, partial [Sphingobacteriales bacterium]